MNTFMDGMEAYANSNFTVGNEKMNKTIPLWNNSLARCGELKDKSEQVEKEFEELTSSPDWQNLSHQIWYQNKEVLESYFDYMIKDYQTSNWKMLGFNAARIQKVYLENAPKESHVGFQAITDGFDQSGLDIPGLSFMPPF